MTRRFWGLAVLSMMLTAEAAPWAALSDGERACSCAQAVCCCAPRAGNRGCHEPGARAQYVRCHHPRNEAPLPMAAAVLPAVAIAVAPGPPVGGLRPSEPARARDGFAGLDPPPPRRSSPLT